MAQISHTGDGAEVSTKQRKRTMRSIRIGAFFVASLALITLLVFVLGNRRDLFGNTFTLYASFENVESLRSGALVYIQGIRVGSVDDVQLVADTVLRVNVKMKIDEKYRPMIRHSSIASIGQVGLVGDKHVEISTEDVNAPIVEDQDVIQAARPINYLAILDKANNAVANVENMTGALDSILQRFQRGEGTLGKFLTDDEAYENLISVGASAEKLFSETTNQFSQMSTILRNTASNVDDITRESESLLRDLGEGKGTIGALLYDRSLYDSLETLVGTLSRTADNAGMAAREFGINMRGLRSNWLVGGLFSGGEGDERSLEMMRRELEIRRDELKRQEELLNRREGEMVNDNP